MHWLGVITGTLPVPSGGSAEYQFFSGFGGSLPDLLLLTALAGWYWHRTCEVGKCWRLRRHTTAGGHAVCRKHMPGGSPTPQDVIDAHNAAAG